jgi:hypothetical protein
VGTDAEGNRGETTDETAEDTPSTPVEWRDIAETPPTSDTGASSDVGSTAGDGPPVADRIRSRSGESLTIETDMLTATLVGVPKVSIADLVYNHHRDKVAETGTTRFCAMFDVENSSTSPIQWRSAQTSFIGSDGYTYERAHVGLNSASLAPGCHTNHVVIEPRCRARVVTPIEQLPQGVDVAKVIHTVSASATGPNQRLIYRL